MVRLGTVVLGVDDVGVAARFWSDALDLEVVTFDDSDNDFTILRPHGGGPGTRIGLQLTATPPQDHPRVHVDLIVDSAAEQSDEIDRLTGLGAERVDWDSYPDDPDFVVLADPAGNRFCIVDASHG
jgi:catechol 2,3-dioxygenase-like lactoylglutathione lyase family enzyme